MRKARIKAEGAGFYHCMSRVIERRSIFGDWEKERFLTLMRKLGDFGGLEILTYCLMSNHFHILVRVPARRELSDEEFLNRLAFLLEPREVKQIGLQLRDFRRQRQEAAAEALKARFTYRMHDISEFFKALKQRFSQAYNRRVGRSGPLWEQRFKSLLVEGAEDVLTTVAAYIDLNPVRAHLVLDPKDYHYGGYGAATAGSKAARKGLEQLLETTRGTHRSWSETQAAYRQRLYVQGRQKGLDPEGRPIRQGFTLEEVQKVLDAGGQLPIHEVLRCRVRYFTDGLALGRQEFLQTVFARYRGQFGAKRQSGARPMRFGEWGGLCTLRDLRLRPVMRC